MQIENYKQIALENVRITIYVVIIVNGLFIQYIAPFHYLCDYDGYSCLMCGMRYAVDEVLKGNFSNAYQSNPIIIVLIVFLLFSLGDTINIIYKRFGSWRRKYVR